MKDEVTKSLMKRYQELEQSDPAAAERFLTEHQSNEKFFKLIDLKRRLVPLFKQAMNKRHDSINAAMEEDEEIRRPMLESILEEVKEEVKKQLSHDDARRVRIQDFKVSRDEP